jgi:hypothetical protein
MNLIRRDSGNPMFKALSPISWISNGSDWLHNVVVRQSAFGHGDRA